jgi:hypothetical protein
MFSSGLHLYRTIGSEMEPFKKSNIFDLRGQDKAKNSTAERLRTMKRSIKFRFRVALGNVTTHRVNTHISLPWVDPQERINILRGRGPVLQLGDMGAPTINIPPDPAQLRERRALERYFQARRKKSSQPNVNKSLETGSPRASAEVSKHIPSSDVEGGVGETEDDYSENSLLEEYLQEPVVPGHSVKRTGRNLGSTDDENYRIGIIWSDNPSHGRLDCPIRSAADDRRQDFAPPTQISNSAERYDLPDRMTQFDDLIDFGKRYGLMENPRRGEG